MGNRGRRALIGTMMCAVLAVTGCSLPWGGKPKDKRFAEFSEYVPEKLEVKTDLEAVTTRRMPGLHASAAHWVGQREEKPREVLPDQDPRYWFHAVVSVEPDSAGALQEASSGLAGLLPAIYSDLQQYVPEDCAFNAVPEDEADSILDVEHAQTESEGGWFLVTELVVSSDCGLVIVRGRGR